MPRVPNHQRLSSPAFHAFAENYISELSAAEILEVPGVAALVLEDYNNAIIKELDELEPEELEFLENEGQALLETKPEPRGPRRGDDDG